LYRAKALNLWVISALSVGVVPAAASDWVNGDATMFPEHSRRPPTVSQPAAQPAQSTGDDGSVSVSDPGAPGAPSDQRAPHTLQGNVDQFRGAYATGQNADASILQTPLPVAPPQSKLVSAKVFQAWLQQTHPDLGIHLKNEVINVKGQWDDSAHALHNFGIACTKISPRKLNSDALLGTKVLIIDCAGELQTDELRAVAQFVHNGGYLITTDWALDACLARAIPGYVMWNSGYSPSEVVDAHVVAPDSELVRNCAPRAYWKLDSKCQTVKIMRPDKVTVLVRSRQLMRDDPDQIGILAFTFNFGKGKVLHLVGHFDSNSDRAFNNALPDPAPGMGISLRQGIAANFVAEALKRGNPAPPSDSH